MVSSAWDGERGEESNKVFIGILDGSDGQDEDQGDNLGEGADRGHSNGHDDEDGTEEEVKVVEATELGRMSPTGPEGDQRGKRERSEIERKADEGFPKRVERKKKKKKKKSKKKKRQKASKLTWPKRLRGRKVRRVYLVVLM